MKIIINTDGASRGNPGEASYGFVIKDENKRIIYEEGERIGINTNNVAEYCGVLKAFEYIKKESRDLENLDITVIADSLLIIQQLSGNFKVKNENLKKLFLEIKYLEGFFGKVEYKHVLRNFNQEADRMANMALDRK